jgi:hypothetical protein
VAVLAIHAQLPHMKLVTVWYRLFGSVSNIGKLRREEIPNAENNCVENNDRANEYSAWSFIRPLWKNLSHKR